MSKRIYYDQDALNKIAEGTQIITKAVCTTLGPKGRNVALEKIVGSPSITKDGVSVAREVEFDDVRKIGADLFRQASIRTSEEAGDGTTTSLTLSNAIFNRTLQLVAGGHHPTFLKRGMDDALKYALGFLDDFSEPVSSYEDIKKIAILSSNGDVALGDLIAEAMEMVGKDGIITVEEGKGLETTLEFSEGMALESGYLNPSFLSQEDGSDIHFENPYVIVADKSIADINDIIPALELAYEDQRPLLVVAHDLVGQALQICLQNHSMGKVKICAVRCPRIGEKRSEILHCIATLCGGQVINPVTQVSLQNQDTLTIVGSCSSATISSNNTILLGGQGSEKDIKSKIDEMKAKLQRSGSQHDKEFYQKQISQLGGGLSVIKVGASTELELKEYKARIEDALSATQAAIKGGIVPGGGSTLVQISDYLSFLLDSDEVSFEHEDERAGFKALSESLVVPFKALMINAGLNPERALIALQDALDDNPNVVYDLDNECVIDALEVGVIDPTVVICEVLKNSVSVSSTLATTSALIVNKTTMDNTSK